MQVICETFNTIWIVESDNFAHRISFENVKEKFAGFLNPANGVIKAIIEIE